MPSEKKSKSEKLEEEESSSKSKSRYKENDIYGSSSKSKSKSEKNSVKEDGEEKKSRSRKSDEKSTIEDDKEKLRSTRRSKNEENDENDEKRRDDKSSRRHRSSKQSEDIPSTQEAEVESRKSKHDRKRDDNAEDGRKEKHRSSKKHEDNSEDRSERKDKESREKSDDKSRRHKSKSKEDDNSSSSSKDSKSRSSRDHKSKMVEIKEKEEYEEPVYEEDFDDDFEDIESEPEVVTRKVIEKPSKPKDEDQTYSRRSENRSNKIFEDEYDYEYNKKDKVIKANAHIQIRTELVEVYSSKIYFNHDSIDRQQRRAKDLLKTRTIELDKKNLSLLEINPTEMRTVYSSHLKHEKVQTNDDLTEIEIQTDDIDYTNRWVQHPPEDLKGFGTDDINENDEPSLGILENLKKDLNFIDLQRFLDNSAKVVEKLLNENSSSSNNFEISTKTDIEFSAGFTKFTIPKHLSKYFKGFNLTVQRCCFSREDSNFLACTYDLISTSENDQNGSLLLIWNLTDSANPYRVLICETKSTSCCYTNFLVFSGMVDGSLVAWDLRESVSLHTLKFKETSANGSNVLRSPTYTTAGILFNENHFSEVNSIVPLQSSTANSNSTGVFMQLATLELECKLIIWTVIELNNVDLAGFENDLGLLPGGKIKLIKSSQIELNNLLRHPTSLGDKIKFQTMSMACPMDTSNCFYVCTNLGRIIQVVRENETLTSKSLKSEFTEGNLQVCCASFHPENQDVLLAGYGNGELRLYHTNYVLPIKTWHLACQGNKINEIHWMPSRSSSFILSDEKGQVYFWNLLTDDTQPVYTIPLNGFGGISLSFAKQNNISNQSLSKENNSPCAIFNLNSKELDVHLLKQDYPNKNDKETKKFPKLIKNYLLTF